MFTINYMTGNGYNCSCCRYSNNDLYEADSEEDAINFCITTARSYDGDFSISSIEGYEGNADELEEKILKVIGKNEELERKKKAIAQLKRNIEEIEHWQQNLPAEIKRKAGELAELKLQLESKS